MHSFLLRAAALPPPLRDEGWSDRTRRDSKYSITRSSSKSLVHQWDRYILSWMDHLDEGRFDLIEAKVKLRSWIFDI